MNNDTINIYANDTDTILKLKFKNIVSTNNFLSIYEKIKSIRSTFKITNDFIINIGLQHMNDVHMPLVIQIWRTNNYSFINDYINDVLTRLIYEHECEKDINQNYLDEKIEHITETYNLYTLHVNENMYDEITQIYIDDLKNNPSMYTKVKFTNPLIIGKTTNKIEQKTVLKKN